MSRRSKQSILLPWTKKKEKKESKKEKEETEEDEEEEEKEEKGGEETIEREREKEVEEADTLKKESTMMLVRRIMAGKTQTIRLDDLSRPKGLRNYVPASVSGRLQRQLKKLSVSPEMYKRAQKVIERGGVLRDLAHYPVPPLWSVERRHYLVCGWKGCKQKTDRRQWSIGRYSRVTGRGHDLEWYHLRHLFEAQRDGQLRRYRWLTEITQLDGRDVEDMSTKARRLLEDELRGMREYEREHPRRRTYEISTQAELYDALGILGQDSPPPFFVRYMEDLKRFRDEHHKRCPIMARCLPASTDDGAVQIEELGYNRFYQWKGELEGFSPTSYVE